MQSRKASTRVCVRIYTTIEPPPPRSGGISSDCTRNEVPTCVVFEAFVGNAPVTCSTILSGAKRSTLRVVHVSKISNIPTLPKTRWTGRFEFFSGLRCSWGKVGTKNATSIWGIVSHSHRCALSASRFSAHESKTVRAKKVPPKPIPRRRQLPDDETSGRDLMNHVRVPPCVSGHLVLLALSSRR